MTTSDEVAQLQAEVAACVVCQDLPLGPRPVVQFSKRSKIVIIGQAPGRRVHESGVPWDDPSGRRLRAWLGVDDATFYDPDAFALLPMGFCFPGTGTAGDLPPRPECAPLWHERVLSLLDEQQLTLILGQYALARYLPAHRTVTAAARAYGDLLPALMALPHPSPRNNRWMTRNGWFDQDAVPRLRARVQEILHVAPPA